MGFCKVSRLYTKTYLKKHDRLYLGRMVDNSQLTLSSSSQTKFFPLSTKCLYAWAKSWLKVWTRGRFSIWFKMLTLSKSRFSFRDLLVVSGLVLWLGCDLIKDIYDGIVSDYFMFLRSSNIGAILRNYLFYISCRHGQPDLSASVQDNSPSIMSRCC